MRLLHKWIAFVLLFIAVLLVNFISTRINMQVDLTEGSIYTLSEGSHELLREIDEPIELRFYFSRSVEALPIQFKNYATRVESLLRRYQGAGNGRIVISMIDPRPDTDQEEAAVRAGISEQRLANGERLFFGLQAIQADEERVIPFFSTERERFLEYDISQLIYQVQQIERPRLGIITSLDMVAPPPSTIMPELNRGPRDWVVVQELKKIFQVERVTGRQLPEDLDMLAIIHPGFMNEELQFAIDQFLLSGRPLFIAVDPSSIYQRATKTNTPAVRPGAGPYSSDMKRLLEGWGIRYNPNLVVGDLERGTTVTFRPGSPPVNYPVFLSIRDFDQESPITGQLREVQLIEPGFFIVPRDTGLEVTPLIQTSRKSGTMMASAVEMVPPEQMENQISPDDTVRTLAAVIRGTFRSAFPEGRPLRQGEDEFIAMLNRENEQSFKESETESTIVLVADTDFLADQFMVRRGTSMGAETMEPINDNIFFVGNIIDTLAGSQDLISIRGKGSSIREFSRIAEMERVARVRFQARLEDLERRLADIRQRIANLQQQSEQGQLIASAEILTEIERFRLEELDVRRQQREIRKQLREDIEAMNYRLAAINLLIIPLLIAVFGAIYFTRRGTRKSK